MKRFIALLLATLMLLSSCSRQVNREQPPESANPAVAVSTSPPASDSDSDSDSASDSDSDSDSDREYDEPQSGEDIQPEYASLSDPALLQCVEDTVYSDLIYELNSDLFFVENVSAVYISNEYLEEIAYNSQANIYFGFTLAELEDSFQGSKFIFTLGDDGQTTVQEFEHYDDTFDKVIRNVAIGTGVVLLCVTVSTVTAGAAPAVSVIFAASAKSASSLALSGGLFSGVVSGVVTGFQTKDFEQAIKAAALSGSEGFMWGAITGGFSGGVTEAIALKGATLSGLTMNQAAIIQRESRLPLDVIKTLRSPEQYEILKNANIYPELINGKTTLIRNIDLNYVDEVGRTNLQRMEQGLAALDPTGISYELHHIGQNIDSTLAILTKAEHMQGGNNLIWHDPSISSAVHAAGNTWDATRQAIWKSIAQVLGGS